MQMYPFGGSPQQQEPAWNSTLADFVNKEFKRRQVERRSWELQWRLNEEFVNDNQYLQINSALNSVTEVPRIWWWQEREAFNHIAPIYETRVSRLSRIRPRMVVRPFSAEMDDVAGAEISKDLLDMTYHRENMAERMTRLISWMELHGTAFVKPVWNPRRGRLILHAVADTGKADPDNTTGEPENVQELAGLFGGGHPIAQMFEGDIETMIVPAYEIYPDSPWRDDMSEVRSIIHAKAYPIEQIYDVWGAWVDEEDVDALGGSLSHMRGNGGLGYGAGGYHAEVRKIKRHAIVKEYSERPSARYPMGRFIVVAGSKTLYAGPLPFHVGKDMEPDIPIVRFVAIHRPGCFWGKSIVERLIPLQRRYNALRNRIAEHLNRVVIGGWYKQNGSTQDDEDLDSAPGLIVSYERGYDRPQPIQWPSLPQEFFAELETLMREFTVISGVSETARFSEAPPGIKSGVALAITIEQDDTRMAATAINIAQGVAEVGKIWLRLYRQFVKEPRLLRKIGNSKLPITRYWSALDIRSDDVVLEGTSGLLETPAQRRLMVMDLLGAGLFNNPETGQLDREGRHKVFEMLQLGNWEQGGETGYEAHRSKARRNIRHLIEGRLPSIDPFDDHEVHLEEVTRYRLTTEYEKLLQERHGPLVKAVFDWYVQSHSDMLMQKMQQQQLAMQAQEQSMQQQGLSVGPIRSAPIPDPGQEAARVSTMRRFGQQTGFN